MDPCPFVRLIVESLALKLPIASKPAGSGIHPSTTPCFCKIRLKNISSETIPLPLLTSGDFPPESSTSSAGFHLDPDALRQLSRNNKPADLHLSVFTGRMGHTCGVSSGRLLGHVRIGIDLREAESRSCVFYSGWVKVMKGKEQSKPSAQVHIVVRSEPDPRFVFQFGGEPECSPVVFQIQGSIRQPVFSCKFSADRNSRSRSLQLDPSNNTRRWLGSFGNERERLGRDRKGWMIMIHDLSGSPVAAASMITPFVPSPGSDRVSCSNPGSWLILRPHGFSVNSWKPWGRLEAWRERGPTEALGCRFELVTDTGVSDGTNISESVLSVRKGGQFCIDTSMVGDVTTVSGPFGGDFVMRSTVEGEGKVSKPMVQVGLRHVMCMADAAAFIALSAAVDLSMDACRLFSQKLRKELCYDQQNCS